LIKEESEMAKNKKNKKDFGKIATKVMIVVLTLMMVLSVAASLIYYIVLN
jgi:flagellar basal body-associated protein FliL